MQQLKVFPKVLKEHETFCILRNKKTGNKEILYTV